MIYLKQYFFFPFIFTLINLFSFSQTSTLEIHKESPKSSSEKTIASQFNRVMVIPFETKMYMSEADKDISEKTGKNQKEICEIFRKGICNNVFIEAKMIYNSTFKSLSMHSQDPELIADLDFIYKSIGYKYLPVPLTPDTSRKTPLGTLKSASDKAREVFDGNKTGNKSTPTSNNGPGTGINNGQISTPPQVSEKYMATSIVNPEVLAFLSSKYECDFFIFINQMDFVVPPNTDYRNLSSGNYSRMIKIHYSIFNKSGKEIYGDAAKTFVSSSDNDAQAIVNSKFDGLAKEIVSHLENPNHSKEPGEKKPEKSRSSYDEY